MFTHVMVGTDDIDRARRFYDAVFAALGAQPGRIDAKGRLAYVHGGSVFMVTRPLDGKPATHANGGTIGFATTGAEQADAWHRVGLAHGGTAIEDPPGMRTGMYGPIYIAYLRDPDGNKLCALHRFPAEAR